MKAGAVLDFVTRLIASAAEAIQRRREAKKRDDHGDGGGHPTAYPLEEARRKVRERREGQP